MSQLNEELLANDLEDLVDNIFEIDSYTSKMGTDADICVLSFTIDSLEASKDLVNFIERGYDFVLDSDFTPGELNDGKYKVFVEIQRTRRIPSQIMELLNGIKLLTNLKEFKFRYYKSFHSIPASDESLTENVPVSKEEYESRKNSEHLNNFSNFFHRSYLESIHIDDDNLIFKKRFAEPLKMKIIEFGNKIDVYSNQTEKPMFESKDIGEIMFLSKYIGEFNISKIGENFIFENSNKALVLRTTK